MNENLITDESNLIIEIYNKKKWDIQLGYKIYNKNGNIKEELNCSICKRNENTLKNTNYWITYYRFNI